MNRNPCSGYPLVICYIAIENGPFSSLIYPLKMLIFHVFLFTRGYPFSEPFHIPGMRAAPSDSRILQGAAARCASLLQSEDAAVRSTAAEALGRWVKDGVCVMNYAMNMPISLYIVR